MTEKKLIVSLTSYPARIGTLHLVLESIYAQTRKADEIVLWLAEEQFPQKMEDLTQELRSLAEEGRLTIRWCDDLKPHKKYFYALQEYSNDLVVTIDDDLLYSECLLENLYQSYLAHPDAISAVRAHLIVVSENGRIMPYCDWIQETDVCIHEPSMQLFSTGGAGSLYPPGIFKKELFDKEVIKSTCLLADDLWIKAMALLCDVPVVVAQEFEELRYVPGTQTEALYHGNVDKNLNDVQLEQINQWVDEHYEKDLLIRKLTESDIGVKILGIEAVCMHSRKEREKKRDKIRQLNGKLKQTYEEKSERGIRIRELENVIKSKDSEIAELKEHSMLYLILRKIYRKLKHIEN